MYNVRKMALGQSNIAHRGKSRIAVRELEMMETIMEEGCGLERKVKREQGRAW